MAEMGTFFNVGKRHADQLGKLYEHNYRQKNVENADSERVSENEEIISMHGKTYKQAYEEKIYKSGQYNGAPGHRIRKDAVAALEIVMTYPGEKNDYSKFPEWRDRCIEWLRKTYNRRADLYGDNIISVVCHYDETSPHLHAVVVPIDENGRLNAKSFTSGMQSYARQQEDFEKSVTMPLGFKPRIKKQVGKKIQLNTFYGALDKEFSIEAPPINSGERIEDYRNRMTQLLREQNMRALNAELQSKKKIEEIKSINRETLTNTRKELHKERKAKEKAERILTDLVEKYGDGESIEKVKSKLITMELLNSGLDKNPDREFAESIRDGMNRIVSQEKERQLKKQRNLEIS